MAIYLKISENDEEERVRLSTRPFLIGRSNKCHKTLTDALVSGRHLAVKINEDQRVIIKDLETTNGTFLNGAKIDESFLYLDDFIQIGEVTLQLDDSEMSSKELALHQRDYERTNVTFVKMSAQIPGVEDMVEDDAGQLRQKNLLAKVREKKELDQKVDEETRATKVAKKQKEILEASKDLKVTESKRSKKKIKKKVVKDKEEDSGLVGKLKGLFKK